ncbi:MAG: hypothetical protein QM796_18370 [Chthoniobacteraceae bacterium]
MKTITSDEVWPHGWVALLDPGAPIAIGYDPATTTKGRSNPSAISVVQKLGVDYYARAVIRFKTGEPKVARAIIASGLAAMGARNLRPRRLCVAATNERFFATDLRTHFASEVPVELVIESERTSYLGEAMNFKTYLGNLLVNALEDGHCVLPNESWLRKDWRSVKREGGGFVYELDEDGNHADTWVATALALHGLGGAGGSAKAAGMPTGTFGSPRVQRQGIRNPYAHLF